MKNHQKLPRIVYLPRWMFLKIETDEGVVGWGEPVIEVALARWKRQSTS